MSLNTENKTEKNPRFKVKSSYVWGGAIALFLGAWLLSGQFNRTPGAVEDSSDQEVAEIEKSLTSVRVQTLEAVPHEVTLSIRGRTEAVRSVQIRAETAARVVALPAEKGTFVSQGDVLCELSVDARNAQVQEARALLKQRKLEWDAAQRLQKQGHRSETQTAAIEAGYRSAQANLRRMEIELERTQIRAPYAGIFDDRRVEIGDFMQPGQVCGSVVAQDPFLVVGQVSERDVGRVKMGDKGMARLLSGEFVSGHIRYVASAADPATRTFKIELEIPNPSAVAPQKTPQDGEEIDASSEPMVATDISLIPRPIFRDGITAELFFPLGSTPAHHLSPAVLGLNTKGEVGVRTIDGDNIVSFVRVQIISDTVSGVWVSGLPPVSTIITVGQELVSPGEKVLPIREEKELASTTKTDAE